MNINLGPPGQAAPSSSYGAATGSAGVWNHPDYLSQVEPLVDLSGAPTGATFHSPIEGAITGVDACLMGDEEAFMQNFVDPLPGGSYQFNGLVNGTYDVYSYCLATDQPTITTEVEVVGSAQGWQTVGGQTWCVLGGHGTPTTYAVHTVQVTNGSLTIVYDEGVNAGDTFNGFQLILGGLSQFVPFCQPNNANSTGQSTTLGAALGTGVESGLRLTASQGVPGEFGYFLVSQGMADPGIVLSGGQFCLLDGVHPFGRYNFGSTTNSVGTFDAVGSFQNLVGTATSNSGYGFDVPTQNPIPGSATIQSGETWNFQLWHRDTPAGGGASTFSNGLSVTFP